MDDTTSRIPLADPTMAREPLPGASDAWLVESLRRGDADAPLRLIERYSSVIYGIAFGMLRHRQDAEDVTQETLVRALRSIARFDASRPLRPWLISIAANRCRTLLERRSRSPSLCESLDGEPEHRRDPGPPRELLEELDCALERLRPEYRVVFTLYHEQNMPYEEIALSIDRPVGTIKTWLHRARAELARHLGSRGFDELL